MWVKSRLVHCTHARESHQKLLKDFIDLFSQAHDFLVYCFSQWAPVHYTVRENDINKIMQGFKHADVDVAAGIVSGIIFIKIPDILTINLYSAEPFVVIIPAISQENAKCEDVITIIYRGFGSWYNWTCSKHNSSKASFILKEQTEKGIHFWVWDHYTTMNSGYVGVYYFIYIFVYLI